MSVYISWELRNKMSNGSRHVWSLKLPISCLILFPPIVYPSKETKQVWLKFNKTTGGLHISRRISFLLNCLLSDHSVYRIFSLVRIKFPILSLRWRLKYSIRPDDQMFLTSLRANKSGNFHEMMNVKQLVLKLLEITE